MQIIPRFMLGGAEIMCENLSTALYELGHDVIVVSLNDFHSPITERLEAKGLKVRYLNKHPGPDPFCLMRLRKLIRQEKPEAIHSHINSVPYAMLAGMMEKVPVHVHTIHSLAQEDNVKAIRKIAGIGIKKKAIIPVALGKVTRDSIRDEYKIPIRRIPIIENGIDLSRCILKESYEKKETFTFIHIGRFVDVKNHICLIEAFSRFHKLHPDSRLVLVGDGELRPDIEKQIKDLHMQDAIVLTGEQKNVFGFLHDADCFVISSKYEGLPMTLIEAMGTGLPVIATNVGGIKDTLKDGEDAILCEPIVGSLEAAMTRMYEEDDLRKKLALCARDHSERFSSKRMAERYIRLYWKLIN